MKHSTRRILKFIAALSLFPFFATVASGYVASSSNYRLQSDSINVGGVLSTSTSYRLEDTVGEAGTGTSSSATYGLKAGYQQMQESYLAITSPGSITLSPNISAVGGGTGNGQAIWTITTDNLTGYSASIRSSTSPALASGANNFANYTTAGADPDYAYAVGASAAEFGFTVEGADTAQRFLDNGSACNTGSGNVSDTCWDALLTSATTIARRTSPNNPSGIPMTVKFRAESGASNVQPAGSYTATTTITVMAL